MLIFLRLIPFLLGGVTGGVLYFLNSEPSRAPLMLFGLVALVIWGVGKISGFGKSLEGWWHVGVTLVLFLVSVVSFMFFLDLKSLVVLHLLAVATGLFVFFFTEHLFRFVHLPSTYQPYALEYTSLVLHIASMFFLSTAFYGLQTFLQIPIWFLSVLFLVFSGLLVYETLWVSKIRDSKALRVAVIGSLILTEMFIVFSMLPTSFYVNAAATALVFYMFLGMMRAELLQRLSKEVIRRYVILGFILLLILFVTARWI